MKITKKEIGESSIYFLNENKYKTKLFVVRIKMELDASQVTGFNLLTSLLDGGSKKYPSIKKLSSYLSSLYGSSVYISSTKRGKVAIVELAFKMIDDKFVGKKVNLLEKNIELISEIFYRPLIKNNRFPKKYFENRLEISKNNLLSILDDKDGYSDYKLLELFGKKTSFGIYTSGYLSDYQKLDQEVIIELYNKLLGSNLEFYFVGDVEEEVALKLVEKYFDCSNKKLTLEYVDKVDKEEIKGKKEIKDISQTRLLLALTTGLVYGEDFKKECSLSLFNAIFGGLPMSKLFMNIREKHGYCYSINSISDLSTGVMIVYANINSKNLELVKKLVFEELEKVKNGDISDSELIMAKKLLINNYVGIKDNQSRTYSFYSLFNDLGVKRNIDQYIQMIESISINDIKEVAKNILYKTSFVLEGR